MKELKIIKNETFKGTIAVIHTTAATLDMIKNAILEYLPNARIINFLDDSITGDLKNDSSCITYVYEKIMAYSKFAERQGADIIVNACSTVGEFKTYATGKLSVPLVRIDDAVTDAFCEHALAIAIIATASITVTPSSNIVHAKADSHAKVDEFLIEKAAEFNSLGDKEAHDKLIAQKTNEIADKYDAIFLAQASMADAINYIDEKYKDMVYTSLPYCVAQIVQIASRIKK